MQNKSKFVASEQMIYRKNIKRLNQLLSILSLNFLKRRPVVSVIKLEGVIGKVGLGKIGLTLDSLDELIRKAFNTERVIAVCLVINSPGGSPVQSDLIATRITNLSSKYDIPVYSFVEDMAASGGYWLACAGEEIYVNRSSLIGSIGVVARGFGFAEMIKKIGVERRVYTQGENKSVLDPFTPEKKKDIELITDIQKYVHQHFIDAVKISRHNRLTQSDEILFDGTFWSGQTAVDYGLVDGIDDLYSFINKKFGHHIKIEYIKPKTSWLQKKLNISVNLQKIANNVADHLLTKIESKIDYDKFDLK
ncbi:MAG: S49 family peptidase [Rickettsiaceae bacterium]|nr:S49 family peptidase [Rickettsiaceae bacterium]